MKRDDTSSFQILNCREGNSDHLRILSGRFLWRTLEASPLVDRASGCTLSPA
jgi:hypothetical protein